MQIFRPWRSLTVMEGRIYLFIYLFVIIIRENVFLCLSKVYLLLKLIKLQQLVINI